MVDITGNSQTRGWPGAGLSSGTARNWIWWPANAPEGPPP